MTTSTYAANGVAVTAIMNGLGTMNMAYNSTHDLTAITDRLNRITSIAYNGYGQVTSITDARGVVATYTYNASRQFQTEQPRRQRAGKLYV